MLLFLDFDGVLHPEKSRTEPKFCRLPLLEAWLRERPGVEVVISSSWREVHPFAELVSFFAEDLQHRVIGVTPQFRRIQRPERTALALHVDHIEHEREAEIRSWINSSTTPARRWAALDDMPNLFQPGCGELVVCDPTVGLTEGQLQQVEGVLLRGSS